MPRSWSAATAASILVETGHPKDFPVIERHLAELFAQGVAPPKYLFVTHQETPHCGGLGRILKTFPDALPVSATSAIIISPSRNTNTACAGCRKATRSTSAAAP